MAAPVGGTVIVIRPLLTACRIVDGQPGIAYLATTRGEDVTDVQVRMDDAPDGDAAVWMPAHRVRLA